MNESNLRPASYYANQFGVKALIYGGPGLGKTPLLNTAPNPVLLACEPGLLSMRNSNIPTWVGDTPERINEFFAWLNGSKEAAKYDTVGVDSISQMAEIILAVELGRCKDPRKAYGNMSRDVMEIANGLFFMRNKHTYLIAKQSVVDENGGSRKKPYFPGQDLNVKVPHLYDEILHLEKAIIPGMVGEHLAIRCHDTLDTMARDRSGRCDMLEPPHIGNLFKKIMS